MSKFKAFYKWVISGIIAAFLFMIAANYWIMTQEPYKLSEDFIYKNPIIEKNLGEVLKVRIAFLGDSVTYSGLEGHAEMEINVSGKTGKGAVFIELERDLGEWSVKRARLMQDGNFNGTDLLTTKTEQKSVEPSCGT